MKISQWRCAAAIHCSPSFANMVRCLKRPQAPSALRNLHPGPGVEAWGVRDTVSFEDSALGCQVPLLPCFQLNMPILMDKMLSTFWGLGHVI